MSDQIVYDRRWCAPNNNEQTFFIECHHPHHHEGERVKQRLYHGLLATNRTRYRFILHLRSVFATEHHDYRLSLTQSFHMTTGSRIMIMVFIAITVVNIAEKNRLILE